MNNFIILDKKFKEEKVIFKFTRESDIIESKKDLFSITVEIDITFQEENKEIVGDWKIINIENNKLDYQDIIKICDDFVAFVLKKLIKGIKDKNDCTSK